MNMISIPADYTASNDALGNRIILVSGAGDGIGAVLARTCAEHGASVILLGRTVQKLERVYDEIINSGGAEPLIMPVDLKGATPDHYQQIAASIEQQFGYLDGLVHNAAYLGALTPVEQYEPKLWAEVMQINLHAPFLMTQALLPVLKKSADASILFTSSGVAHRGRAYWGAYGVSKAACDNLMEMLADELESNTSIRVNSIDPGRVRTRMRANAYPGENPNSLPVPEQIMESYLYLLSEESKGVSGKIYSAQAAMRIE